MKKLEVRFDGWGEGWHVGTLGDAGGGPVFEFAPEALRRGVELSPLRVPLGTASFSGPAHAWGLPGFIADSLPDGWGLLLMDRMFLRHGVPPERLSPLDRLAFIGDRAMGALIFEPASDLALGEDDMTLLQVARAAHEVVEDRDIDALRALARVGGSPQGARPKALVRFDCASRSVSTREGAAGEPWLVKFPARGEHKEVCAVEFAYAALARHCGLDMPEAHLFDLGRDMAAFGVARFDREAGLRVPVHSLAGALHADFRLPSIDYRVFLRATRFFTRDEQEVRKAYCRSVFNVAFHNRDDHAKNFAFRMNRRFEWKLAPAYDLTFSQGPGGWHQTSTMGEARAPGRAELLALADDAGLPRRFAVECIDAVCDAAPTLGGLLKEVGVRKATRELVVAAVHADVKRCRSA
jgi:serine/threonine-protein kinase HipA